MDKSKFSFALVDTLAPDVVIGNIIKQIEDATDGYVSGSIENYDGPIQDYTLAKLAGLTAALSVFQKQSG